LSVDALVEVLTRPKGALVSQYASLFALNGVTLTFSDEALREIAREALRRGTGARALRSVLERTLGDAMFDVPGSDVTALHVEAEDVHHPGGLLERATRRKTA